MFSRNAINPKTASLARRRNKHRRVGQQSFLDCLPGKRFACCNRCQTGRKKFARCVVATQSARKWLAKTEPFFVSGRRKRERLILFSNGARTQSERFTHSIRSSVDIFPLPSMSAPARVIGFE